MDRNRSGEGEERENAMNVITMASRKGGAGKSTLIAHLSDFVHRLGRRCFVVDADPQGSLTLWQMLRADQGFRLQSPGHSIQPLLECARQDGVEWAFIDTPPTMNAAVAEAIGLATLVVIPARPALFDLVAVRETVAASRTCRKPYAVVLNGTPPKRDGRDSPVVKQVREHLDRQSIPVWSGQISHRLGYWLALDAGTGIAAAQPDSPAADEIARLWTAIERSVAAINGAYAAADAMHRAA